MCILSISISVLVALSRSPQRKYGTSEIRKNLASFHKRDIHVLLALALITANHPGPFLPVPGFLFNQARTWSKR